MASANAARKAKFMGSAGHEFNSFQELANYSMNTYFPNWKNYAHPDSYMIPLVFEYKHQDVSDEAYKLAQEKLKQKEEKRKLNPKSPQNHEKQDNVIKDRKSDEAEHLVYKAIQQLIQEKFQAPFIAVHGLNINQYENYLEQIFHDLASEELKVKFQLCYREYSRLHLREIRIRETSG